MMKAVGFWTKGLPSSDERSLEDIQLPDPPPPSGRDLLVRVLAVGVNPRDIKSRLSMDPSNGAPIVLGYDASGVVEAVGPDASLFSPGDEVYYAGVLNRQGANAELQLVDERIVGRKPASLDHATAASIPLTSLTAWEMLFDRLALPRNGAADESLLMIGGAGGVPTMAIQIARQLTQVTVVATASRPVSEAWVRSMGAHHVINHFCPLLEQIKSLGPLAPVTRVFSTHTTSENWGEMAEIIAPQGRIGLIDDPEPLDLRLMKFKSVSIHWEAMFTRPMHGTADMQRQHDILNGVAELIDSGSLVAPPVTSYGTLNARNLRKAHAALESGRTVGKIALAGF